MDKLVRKLGIEKIKDMNTSFDEIYDEYKLKAKKDGYNGKLLFQKEKGKIIIFVELED